MRPLARAAGTALAARGATAPDSARGSAPAGTPAEGSPAEGTPAEGTAAEGIAIAEPAWRKCWG